DRNFDGIVPKSESYFINSNSPQTRYYCALRCFQSVVFCIGYLFSSQNASCKLLKTYLTDADKNGNFVGEDWEYRKRSSRWLHSVEIRVGNYSVWSEMATCGTYPGPSETGAIITVECIPSRYGRYVTLKIVQLNYITDDWNARNVNNALVLEEVVVNGLYL
uniref:Uncharacterized protein n=1 Tax=Magallana gigas TaxID=29159 RepID=A0A8W8M021_MAGGI